LGVDSILTGTFALALVDATMIKVVLGLVLILAAAKTAQH
jgi:hypothetical protein